ncbi:ATP-binding protein [Noviherbaspirillum sp. CPCC 100848]|uniref:ATP-binding protein n=1 Tax=Noviherbaspirillum album TaxID=3080276 RepID=A0ABU6J3A6_9BURK|nr:ATP-binding protein [Noviherbaspirillum sp. CPCC 100848]MEC4717933.1 ATP-binding protein [Noviherbaspirillum sp. CPCC 100848]
MPPDSKSKPARIAILGAESSGKSTLAAALAARYGTLWVPEYLREFVETRGRTPREQEQIEIALMQVRREEEAAPQAKRFLFCDTTPLMTALYSQFYWERVDRRLAALVRERHYEMTLVAVPDMPWIADGMQRESDEVRHAIHAMLLALLDRQDIRYELLDGGEARRLASAAALLERLP